MVINKIAKVSFVILLFLSLIGCGGGGGSGGGGSAQLGAISGRIALPDDLSNLRNNLAEGSVSIEVWIKEHPEVSALADEDGNYLLENVPFGTHRVVSRVQDLSGRRFINISPRVSVSQAAQLAQIAELELVTATNKVKGKVITRDSKPVADANMSLWGERFVSDSDGKFVTPKLPEDVKNAVIKIKHPSISNSFEFDCRFFSEIVPEITIKLPLTADSKLPPIVQIEPSKTRVGVNDELKLKSVILSDYSDERLKLDWTATEGKLNVSYNKQEAVWIAPGFDVDVLLKLKVTDPVGLSGSVVLPVKVGQGGKGLEPPSISDASLKAKAYSNSIKISWNKLKNADSYNLYWSNSSGFKLSEAQKLTDVKSPFVHDDIKHNVDYYYVLTAKNAAGTSKSSPVAEARVDSTGPNLLSVFPEHNDVIIGFKPTLSINFEKEVKAISGGAIRIYDEDMNLYQEFTASSRAVKVNCNSVEIELSSALYPESTYSIEICDNSFEDIFSVGFKGIDKSDWFFSTGSAWHLDLIEARNAWQTSTGEGIVIAVIDTGFDLSHPAFEGQLAGDPVDVVNDGIFMEDRSGHGTHVAGIISAKFTDEKLMGIAPGAQILPVKVFDRNNSTTSLKIAEGMYAAADLNVDIVNMSIGTRTDHKVIRDAASDLYSQGIFIVGAAGNNGRNSLTFPGGYAEVVSVGATDYLDEVADFSNYSVELDFVAPGMDILSTVPIDDQNPLGIDIRSGTSMATPHVSAVAAIIKSQNPDYSNLQIYDALVAGADQIFDPISNRTGNGRINAAASLGWQPSSFIRASIMPQQINDKTAKSKLNATDYVQGELFVRLRQGRLLSKVLSDNGLGNERIRVIEKLRIDGLYLLEVPAGSEKRIGKILQADESVIYAELNEIIKAPFF